MTDTIRYAIERFPDLTQAIKQYSSDNRYFQGLCADYGAAVEALRHWKTSPDPNADKHVEDYRALTADLENEILFELLRWTGE